MYSSWRWLVRRLSLWSWILLGLGLGGALAGFIAGLALLKTHGRYNNASSIVTAVVIAAIGEAIGLSIPLFGKIWLSGSSVVEASRSFLVEALPTILLGLLLLPLLHAFYNTIVERRRHL